MYPEPSQMDLEEDSDLWRGERRNFYRLDTQKSEFVISIDLGTSKGITLYDVPVLNLSPAGCCILVPQDSDFQPGFRIPRLTFPFEDEELTIRAKVVHTAVMDVNAEFHSNTM